ncbi:transcriptional repressor NrdR [Actinomycetota bacterium]|nr:transcriptional repressor NrdR [Actinomycetota bacterium]
MHCPFCKHPESKVVDSRISEDGFSIRRRRSCTKCEKRFSTLETAALYVHKRSGVLEEFSKSKLVNGIRKATQGRPIDEDELKKLAAELENDIRAKGVSQIDSYDVGLMLLEPLKTLDVVTYLRYASVYNCFSTLDDFKRAIAALEMDEEK